MYIMCVCLFSTLSHRVGALQTSIIIYTMQADLLHVPIVISVEHVQTGVPKKHLHSSSVSSLKSGLDLGNTVKSRQGRIG